MWPARLSGGYVGVDVFFVVSGFLISLHLLKQLQASNGISFAEFYARRIRRLLPAALLVLAVALVLAWIYLPYPRWERNAQEIASSAFYVENWFLAGKSVNYSELNAVASVSQHYWSLSVEEQFYLLWPLLLLALWLIGSRRRLGGAKVTLLGMAAVVCGSLALSVWWTAAHPAPAYFVTPVRFWEFGLGAIVALGSLRFSVSSIEHSKPAAVGMQLAAIVGFAMIIWSAVTYSSVTAFPGWRATVPAFGTALVIICGTVVARPWHSVLTSIRPVQYIGNVSYSLYLWHWPLLVVGPFVVGRTLQATDKIVIGVITLVLAGLTKRFVEDPGRRWAWLQARPRRTYVAMLVCMLVVALGCTGLIINSRTWTTVPTAAPGAGDSFGCVGPYALQNLAQCPDAFGPSRYPYMTDDVNSYLTAPSQTYSQCQEVTRVPDGVGTDTACDFSDSADKTKVLLLGDSHAQQWQYALLPIAQARHWQLITSYMGACSPIGGYVGFRDVPAPGYVAADCDNWGQEERDLAAGDGTSIVLISFAAREEQIDDGTGRDQYSQYVDGLAAYVAPLVSAGVKVYVIGDPPLNALVRDPDCALLHRNDPSECAVARNTAQPPDPLLGAAAQSGGAIAAIDLTDWFCDATQCYSVVGGVTVYFDNDHLNRQYSTLLSPLLASRIA